jgi:hypothetical protein
MSVMSGAILLGGNIPCFYHNNHHRILCSLAPPHPHFGIVDLVI